MEIIKKKWLRDTTKTVLLIVVLIAAFMGINLLVQNLEIQDIDVTASQLFTLSEESKKQVKDIQDSVTIYVIGFGQDSSIADLAKQYTKQNEKIQVESIANVQDRVDLKSKYNIADETQVIIVESSDRNKILTANDLYAYDYSSYQQMDVSEQKLTNAIIDVTIANKPVVYFLTGHNEYSLETEMQVLKAYIENDVNEVKTLDLLVNNAIPEDASLLIIASPQKDFSEREVELITNYINLGGKILWMNDPTGKGTTYPNMQKILDLFGAKLEDGILLEQDTSRMVLQAPNYIIPTITSTKATKNIASDGGIMLINAGKITLASDDTLDTLNVTNETVLQSSEKSLFRKDVTNGSTSKISSDEEGTFLLGTKLTKKIEDEKYATLYLIANNAFATDYTITVGSNQQVAIGFYNNKDYILNTIAELTQRDDRITIRKDTGVVTYTATQQQDTMIRVIIFSMPALIILAGVIVWQIRRRKK